MRLISQKMASIALAALLAGTVCFGLAGCTSGQVTNTNTPVQTVAGDTNNAYTVELTNSSERIISGIQVKQPGDEAFSSNLMESGNHVANGATITLGVPKQKEEAEGTYKVDVKITYNDGLVSTLHTLDVKDFDAATLSMQGKVSYVTYYSKTAKRNVSTLDLQLYYYTLNDPDALKRDQEEEEEEKRRLEKLEEDLKKTAEQIAAEEAAAKATPENEEDIQSNDLPDDPIETNWDGDDGAEGDE